MLSLSRFAGMDPDNDADHDSTFGGDRESLASSSTSLRSFVTHYQFENGRRYHAYQAGAYSFPNDDKECDRMDLEHENQKLQLQALHLCPLDDPREILDIGTGTGLWAIDMADEYPACQVLGTDLSPVQPRWVPPNCHFEVDDFELQWMYDDCRFDMIHARFLLGAVSSTANLYKNAYSALKPGGWLEITEMEAFAYSDDNSLPEDSALRRWGHLLHEAFERMGKPILRVERYPEIMQEQGFVNVQYKTIKRPTNDWPKDPRMKEIGKYCCLNFLEGLEGFTMAPFTRVLGWREEEVQVFIARVRAETLNRGIHAWQKAIICCGQKPLSPQQPQVYPI